MNWITIFKMHAIAMTDFLKLRVLQIHRRHFCQAIFS